MPSQKHPEEWWIIHWSPFWLSDWHVKPTPNMFPRLSCNRLLQRISLTCVHYSHTLLTLVFLMFESSIVLLRAMCTVFSFLHFDDCKFHDIILFYLLLYLQYLEQRGQTENRSYKNGWRSVSSLAIYSPNKAAHPYFTKKKISREGSLTAQT